jgi:hypothetical protein
MVAITERKEAVKAGSEQFVTALRAAASDTLSVEDLTDLLQVAFRCRNQIDAAVSEVVGALDRAAHKADEGELTMGLHVPGWLSHQLRASSSAGYAMVRLARELPSLPATDRAFQRGDLSAPQAGLISRCVQAVQRGGGDTVEAERRLLEEAELVDSRLLLRRGLSLVHELAPRQMEDMEEERVRQRFLHMREIFDGGYELQGYLDPEGGATFKTALDAILGRKTKNDHRTPSRRRADGMIEMATRVLDSGTLPVRGGVRPHLTITAPLATLMGEAGAPAGLLNWGWPISGRAVRRIAKEAEITSMVINEQGEPISVGRVYRTPTRRMNGALAEIDERIARERRINQDVVREASDPLHLGRTSRLAKPKLSKALAERDRCCQWPGCDRVPEQTQRHHEDAWIDGGGTDIERMCLLCDWHHPCIEKGWRLRRGPGHFVSVVPPWNVERTTRMLANHDPPF